VVLSVKELATWRRRALGASGARVMTRHVGAPVPGPLLDHHTGHLGAAIFIEAALSFVGWAYHRRRRAGATCWAAFSPRAFKPPWWMVVFPRTAITVTILAVNLFGDALRDFWTRSSTEPRRGYGHFPALAVPGDQSSSSCPRRPHSREEVLALLRRWNLEGGDVPGHRARPSCPAAIGWLEPNPNPTGSARV